MSRTTATIPINAQAVIARLGDQEDYIRLVALAELLKPGVDPSPLTRAVAATCLNDANLAIRELAVVVLGQIGAPAAAVLAHVLGEQQPLRLRIAAASALARLGSGAAPAIDALCQCLEGPDELLRDLSSLALGKIGATAVSALRARLVSADPLVCCAAIDALGWIGPAAQEAMPELQGMMASTSADQRLAACTASAKISGNVDAMLPIMLAYLKEADPALRQAALTQTSHLLSAGLPALPHILPCLVDPAAEVRQAAALALGRIGAKTPEAVQALAACLQDPEPEVRAKAGMALAALGPAATSAVPALRRLTDQTDARLVTIAQAAIERITAVASPPAAVSDR